MSEEPEIRRAQYAEKKGEVVLREHEYDGIQEYDQKLPNWWLFIFISMNAFFVISWVAYYQLDWFKTDKEKIQAAMEKIENTKKKALEDMLAQLDNEALINDWAMDSGQVATGQAVYSTHCIACHGEDLKAAISLEGGQTVALPGLPLTDGDWKYGGKPMDIFKIINEGTPEGSDGHNGARMEPWGQKLPPLEIAQLTAYIISKNQDEFMK